MALVDPEGAAPDRLPALGWDGRDIAALLSLDSEGEDVFVRLHDARK